MSNPLDKHIENALADFEGLSITGSIPLRDATVNEIISHILQHGLPQSTPQGTPKPHAPDATMSSPPGTSAGVPAGAPPSPRAKPNVNAWLSRVKRAQVRFEDGRAVLDFEIGV